jgi:hypothetical protein
LKHGVLKCVSAARLSMVAFQFGLSAFQTTAGSYSRNTTEHLACKQFLIPKIHVMPWKINLNDPSDKMSVSKKELQNRWTGTQANGTNTSLKKQAPISGRSG